MKRLSCALPVVDAAIGNFCLWSNRQYNAECARIIGGICERAWSSFPVPAIPIIFRRIQGCMILN